MAQVLNQLKAIAPRFASVLTGSPKARPPVLDPSVDAPKGSDWSWRPTLWTTAFSGFNQTETPSGSRPHADVSVFHDINPSALSISVDSVDDSTSINLRCKEASDRFLSVAVDLPSPARLQLSSDNIIEAQFKIDGSRASKVFTRLNIKIGPNVQPVVVDLVEGSGMQTVGFDLGYSEIDVGKIEGVWVDFIFEGHKKGAYSLSDLTFSRRRRLPF